MRRRSPRSGLSAREPVGARTWTSRRRRGSGGAGTAARRRPSASTSSRPSRRSSTSTRRPARDRPPAPGGSCSTIPSSWMQLSDPTARRQRKAQTRARSRSSGTGRQAGTSLAGGTAKWRLKRGRKARSTAFADGRSQAPARRSSETRRSWSVPQARSIRPLAWAEPARMVAIPSSARARPTWVASSRPGPSSPVGAKTAEPSRYRAAGRPWRRAMSRTTVRYPTPSSCSRKTAPTRIPVASSIPPTRVSQGPRPSSQSCRLPSTWTRSPAWAMRSRRLRYRGPRRVRGEGIPEARSRRRRAGRLMAILSSSASASARWVSLYPRYTVRASSRTRSRSASDSRMGDARPRLPWASPAASLATIAARSRQAVRSLHPSRATASAVVMIPASQRLTTRCAAAPWRSTSGSPSSGETDKMTEQLALTIQCPLRDGPSCYATAVL